MAVSYNRLWKLLVDRKMSKADLRKASGVAPNTMTKLRRDEEVTLTVLGKICSTLSSRTKAGTAASSEVFGEWHRRTCQRIRHRAELQHD